MTRAEAVSRSDISAPLATLGVALRGSIRLVGKVQLEGFEHLPRDRPFILASNHVSYLDSPFLLSFVAGHLGRVIAPAATRGLFVFPLTILLRALGAVPIDRRNGDNAGSLRRLVETLRSRPVLIFPEGGRRKAGTVPLAHPGVAFLALTAGVPVVPVRVSGTDHVLRAFRRPALRIIVGRPLTFVKDDLSGMPAARARAAVARRILDAVDALA